VTNPGNTGPDCAPGLSSCFANGAYVCTNFQTDPSNCGQCRFLCGTNPYCVDGTCQKTDSTCSLILAPSALNFGSLPANTPTVRTVELSNAGGDTCTVVGIALDPSTDAAFSLPSEQQQILSIPAGTFATVSIQCEVTARGSQHSGLVDYQSNDPQHLAGTIFLLATP
jgi:hypothetical protein